MERTRVPRISLSSLVVSDQERARVFYTDILEFVIGMDEEAGEQRWLSVVSDDDPTGVQLLLEPAQEGSQRRRQGRLYAQGIPATSFEVDDIDYEYERLLDAGVVFQSPPSESGGVRSCVLDDTCGNWIRLTEPVVD